MRDHAVVLLLLGVLALAPRPAPAARQAGPPVRLSFADAVARAARAAPAVELADLRAAEARARVRQAGGYILPSLSLGAAWVNRSFNRRSIGIDFPSAPGSPALPDLVGPFDNADARIRVSQTLFDWSGRGRVAAARAQLASVEADGGQVAEDAAQAAALAYLRAARGRAVAAARAADSALAAELVALARAQRDAGVSPAIDVTRAETQLVAATGALVVARNAERRATIDLGRVLGLDAAALELSDTLAADLPGEDVPRERAAAVTLAEARRADLAAELGRGAAARRTAAAIRAERLPRLGVEADYGANGPSYGEAIATRQLAVQVTVPLLDGWRREGRLAEQDAAARGAAARARELRRQVGADVEAALLDLASAAAQQAIAAQALRLGREEVAQARERFSAGVAGHLEVIAAQQSLIRARDADIDARFAAAAARVALARAAGVARTIR